MADTKLSALTALAATPVEADEIYIRDISEAASAESKRITYQNFSQVKAWCNYTSVSTTAILADYNVSGIADNGTGVTTITFDTNFAGTSFAYAGMCGSHETFLRVGALSSSTLQMISEQDDGTDIDQEFNGVICCGAQ
jgi:hypothetical protein